MFKEVEWFGQIDEKIVEGAGVDENTELKIEEGSQGTLLGLFGEVEQK